MFIFSDFAVTENKHRILYIQLTYLKENVYVGIYLSHYLIRDQKSMLALTNSK